MYLYILCILPLAILVLPYLICFIMELATRKMKMKISPKSFTSFKNIWLESTISQFFTFMMSVTSVSIHIIKVEGKYYIKIFIRGMTMYLVLKNIMKSKQFKMFFKNYRQDLFKSFHQAEIDISTQKQSAIQRKKLPSLIQSVQKSFRPPNTEIPKVGAKRKLMGWLFSRIVVEVQSCKLKFIQYFDDQFNSANYRREIQKLERNEQIKNDHLILECGVDSSIVRFSSKKNASGNRYILGACYMKILNIVHPKNPYPIKMKHILMSANIPLAIRNSNDIEIDCEMDKFDFNMDFLLFRQIICFFVDLSIADVFSSIRKNLIRRYSEIKKAEILEIPLEAAPVMLEFLKHLKVKAKTMNVKVVNENSYIKHIVKDTTLLKEKTLELETTDFYVSVDLRNAFTNSLKILVVGDNVKISEGGVVKITTPNLFQSVDLQEETTNHYLQKKFIMTYSMISEDAFVNYNSGVFEWVVLIVKMIGKIKHRSKTKAICLQLLRKEFNSIMEGSCRDVGRENKLIVSAEDLIMNRIRINKFRGEIWTKKNIKILNLDVDKFVFNGDENAERYDAHTKAEFVLLKSEPFDNLPIVKVKEFENISITDRANHTSEVVQRAQSAIVNLHLIIFFPLIDEIAENVVVGKIYQLGRKNKHLRRKMPGVLTQEKQKTYNLKRENNFHGFYKEFLKKELPNKFNRLLMEIEDLQVLIIFNLSLVYTLKMKNIREPTNKTLPGPVNIYSDYLEIYWSKYEKLKDSSLFRGIVGNDSVKNQVQKREERVVYFSEFLMMQYFDEEAEKVFSEEDLRLDVLIFESKTCDIYFPDNEFHIGSASKNYDYYIRFGFKWFRKKFTLLQKDYILPEFIPNIDVKPRKRFEPLKMKFVIEEFNLLAQENKLIRNLLMKNDIGKKMSKYFETADREHNEQNWKHLYKDIRSKMIGLMKDRCHHSKNQILFRFTMRKLIFNLIRPIKFALEKNIYQVLRSLDNSPQIPPYKNMKAMNYIDMDADIEYLGITMRNFKLPVLEIKKLHGRYLMVQTFFYTHKANFFMKKKKDSVFGKFVLHKKFIDIPKKLFYDCSAEMGGININIQGIETVPAIFALINQFKKTDYHDHDGLHYDEFEYYYFNSMEGIDLYRYNMHGKYSVDIQNMQIAIYPKAQIRQRDTSLIVSIKNLIAHESYFNFDLKLSDLEISKKPLEFLETQILIIPQIEGIGSINFNQKEKMNHYLHYNVETEKQFFEKLADFFMKEMEVTLKLNIPVVHNNFEGNEILPLKEAIEQTRSALVHLTPAYLLPIISTYQAFSEKRIYKTMGLEAKLSEGFKPDFLNISERSTKKIVKLTSFNIYAFVQNFKIALSQYQKSSTRKSLKTEESIERIQECSKDLEPNEHEYPLFNGVVLTIETLSLHSKYCLKTKISVDKTTQEALLESALGKLENLHFGNLSHKNLTDLGVYSSNPFFSRKRNNSFKSKKKQQRSSFLKFFDIEEEFSDCLPILLREDSQTKPSTLSLFSPDKESRRTLQVSNLPIKCDSIRSEEEKVEYYNNYFEDKFDEGSDEKFWKERNKFTFTPKQTFLVMPFITYQQNKYFREEEQSFNKTAQHRSYYHKIELVPEDEQLLSPKPNYFKVLHYVHISSMRGLATQSIIEKILGMVMNLLEYDVLKQIQSQKPERRKPDDLIHKMSADLDKTFLYPENEFQLDLKDSKSKLLCVINIDFPQLNVQNEIENAQALITSKSTTQMLLYSIDIQKKKSKHMIKTLIQIDLSDLQFLVAPTILNLESPTLWIEESSFTKWEKGMTLGHHPSLRNKHNLMVKILEAVDGNAFVEIYNPAYYDYIHPKTSIKINLGELNGWMNNDNLWDLVHVIQCLIFERGEKPQVQKIKEEAKKKELESYKRSLIARVMEQNMERVTLRYNYLNQTITGKTAGNKYTNKRIEYFAEKLNISLYEENEIKFGALIIENVKGVHSIFSNCGSQMEIDVFKILIQNEIDSNPKYKFLLYPMLELDKPAYISTMSSNEGQIEIINAEAGQGTSMIKIRVSDGFEKGMVDAEWKVIDHLEFLVLPLNIKLTSRFYKRLKPFFLPPLKQNPIMAGTVSVYQAEKKSSATLNLQIPQTTRDQTSKSPVSERKKANTTSAYKDAFHKSDKLFGDVITREFNQTEREFNSSILEEEKKIPPAEKTDFPIYYKYLRLNQIDVAISFDGGEGHPANIENLKVGIDSMIERKKFWKSEKFLSKVESHLIKCVVKGIPSIISGYYIPQQVTQNQDEKKVEDQRKMLFGKYHQY